MQNTIAKLMIATCFLKTVMKTISKIASHKHYSKSLWIKNSKNNQPKDLIKVKMNLYSAVQSLAVKSIKKE